MTAVPTYADELAEAKHRVGSFDAEVAEVMQLPTSAATLRRYRVLCIMRDWWQQELARLRRVS